MSAGEKPETVDPGIVAAIDLDEGVVRFTDGARRPIHTWVDHLGIDYDHAIERPSLIVVDAPGQPNRAYQIHISWPEASPTRH